MAMQFSVRKFLGMSLLAVALTFTSFGGRPFLEAQQPAALQSHGLADLLAATADAAAVDYFLKLDGIDGESTDVAHKGEIQVESWSFGASQSGTAASTGGAGAGKVSMQDFHFTMKVNKASPKLFLAAMTGQHIKEAVLVLRKSGGEQVEFMKVTLTDLLVSSYQSGGSAGDIVPTDQFSLNFTKIQFEYRPQRADGTLDAAVTACFNVLTNSRC